MYLFLFFFGSFLSLHLLRSFGAFLLVAVCLMLFAEKHVCVLLLLSTGCVGKHQPYVACVILGLGSPVVPFYPFLGEVPLLK